MPITVVGSIAYDSVATPLERRERMLGGAAVHFALAATFFDEVRIVGPVGDDFREEDLQLLRERGVDVGDVERVPGDTFFWRGEYGPNLATRETLDTRLGVFEGFQPKLSERSRSSDVLFLANIQPDLQREVRGQLPNARFVALDSMNLWIDIARDSLVAAIEGVDLLVLNDEELRQLTGEGNLLRAARELLTWRSGAGGHAGGPRAVVAKQGEHGAALYSDEGVFSLPAFPLEDVSDPTGAGDTFAGGLVGYVAARPLEQPGHELLVRAMAYGTALAAFNVEGFGTERVARLAAPEITARVAELERLTRFEAGPDVLRSW
jgi:sugar/nucleoside kinase (ribokinase family)